MTVHPVSSPSRHAARSRSRKRRVLLVIGLVFLLLVVGAAGLFWAKVNSYTGNVTRIPHAFPQEEKRPPKAAAAQGSLTFLLVGSDSRSEDQTTGDEATGDAFKPGAQRTDTIMLVHLTKKRDKAYVVSIPRDSWVDIPGHGTAKVNASYSYGGAPLLIQTVEQLTDVRVDHLAIIDFAGFKGMTSALDGVDVNVAQTTTDPRSGRTFPAGVNHLEGEAALDFVRQRYGLPRGDLDRVQRQQSFMRALMAKTVSAGTLKNPLKVDDFLQAVTKSVSTDDSLSGGDMRSLALSLRGMRSDDVTFMTAPVAGLGSERGQSIVRLDKAKCAELWDALRKDKMAAYLSSAQGNDVSVVR